MRIKINLSKKMQLFCLAMTFVINASAQQYSITGPDCVVAGYNYGAYQITGPFTSNQTGQWCVTGGTIVGTTSSCLSVSTNVGSFAFIGVNWNTGITSGTVAYYKTGNPTALASFNVTVLNNVITPVNITAPYVPLNQRTNVTISGSEIPPCLPAQGFRCVWQKSINGTTYVDLPGSNLRDLYLNEIFTQNTYYRRAVTSIDKTSYSNVVQLVTITGSTVTAGTISPKYILIKESTSPATPFTASAATGGLCAGNYTYTWEKSTDNVNWTSTGVSGLTYTPPATGYTEKTYLRQKIQCGPPINYYTDIAIVDIYKPLKGGTISPASLSIAAGTSPGTLTCNAASNGNTTSTYAYQWQQSVDDGTTFTDISGAAALNYTAGTINATTLYRRKVTCDGKTAYSTTATVVTYSTPDPLQNYIKTRVLTKPAVTTASEADGLTELKEVKQSTAFYDGLGRPVQLVLKQGSLPTATNAATDRVTVTQYDAQGRVAFNYLPYVSTSADGSFKNNALPEQNSFNNTQFTGENFHYGQTDFEASPLNRITNVSAPGMNWTGMNRNISSGEFTNTLTDAVRIWTVTPGAAGTLATYSSWSIYQPGELYKSITTDERGNQVIAFKDKEGKVVLKKVQLTAGNDDGAGSGYAGWLSTCYIYDEWGRLRAVIQPEGMNALSITGWSLTTTLLDEQCFRYEYDARSRMIRKKVPGAAEVWMVYDARDRLVMSQDANLRGSHQWLYTQYDELNRPTTTGLLTDNTNYNNLTYHLAQAYNSAAYPVLSGYTAEELSKTFYDDYSWRSSYGNPLSATYNTAHNTYLASPSNTVWPYPQATTQSNLTRGLVTGTRTKVLGSLNTYLYTVNIYDDKGRIIQVQATNSTNGTDIITTQYSWSDQPLTVVQKQEKGGSSNPQTHVLVTKLEYDDLGRLLKTKKTINSTINGVAVNKPEVTTLTHEYDALGQLKTKKIGQKKDNTGSYTTDPVETLTYDYNIRGWLLGVNRDYLADNATGKYFGFELGYDKLTSQANRDFAAAQYNGNINGMAWKSKGDGIQRKYDFGYDAANRLLKADFEQHNSNGSWNNSEVNFNVKMGDGSDATTAYDANGNIKRMQQWGLKITGSVQIDDLQYGYYANSNKLSAVTENAPGGSTHKLGDFSDKNTAGNDYGYDPNGNLVTDLNKGINGLTGSELASGGAITYNHLNLPKEIKVKDENNNEKGTITYTYDAAGNKLQKTVADKTTAGKTITTTTTYLGGAVYESRSIDFPAATDPPAYTDRLQFMGQEEGRIRYTEAVGTIPAHYDYDYFIKDHLGNVRMVLTDEQQQSIYPAVTLEGTGAGTDPVVIEKTFYSIQDAYIVPNATATGINSYQNNNGNPPANNNPNCSNTSVIKQTDLSQKLYKLNSSTNTTGLGITLKVMAGDKVNIFGKSYYFQNNTAGSSVNAAIPVSELVSNLLGTPTGVTAGKAAAADLTGNSAITGLLTTFLNKPEREDAGNPQKPKAAINWLLLDENFRYVAGNFSPVGAANAVKDHYSDAALQHIPVTKNGYLYVYVSNQSPVNVFFDNLQVVHDKGALLEETHYYPFGLTMAGISSKAMVSGTPENKIKFQSQEFASKEFSDGSGLEMYEFKWRMHDPQIGRFWQVDALAAKYEYNSPYAFSENKVTVHRELEGLEAEYIFNKAKQELANAFQGLANAIDKAVSVFNKSSSSADVQSGPLTTTTVGTTVTTTTSLNAGGNMNYIIAHNSNAGNPEPATKTTVTVSGDTKTTVNTPIIQVSQKTSVDNNGVVNNETGVKGNIKLNGVPVAVTASASTGTDGQTKMTIQGATGTSNTQAVGQAQYSTKGNQQAVLVGVGVQQKAGNTTVTTIFGIKFSW